MLPAPANADGTAKVCTDCGTMTPLDQFYDQQYGLFGKGSRCMACLSARHKARRSSDGFKERERKQAVRREYGISEVQYADLYRDPTCRACGVGETPGKRLHFDHDHATGAVRGLLCRNCNVALGHLGDDPERIKALYEYICRAGNDADTGRQPGGFVVAGSTGLQGA